MPVFHIPLSPTSLFLLHLLKLLACVCFLAGSYKNEGRDCDSDFFFYYIFKKFYSPKVKYHKIYILRDRGGNTLLHKEEKEDFSYVSLAQYHSRIKKKWLYRQSQCHTSHNFAAFCKVAVHFMRIESGLQIVKYCSSLICKNHGKDQSNLKYRQQMLCMIAPPQTQENFSPTSFSPPTPKKRRAMIQKKAGTINQALI